MNQGTKLVLLMKKNKSQKSRASVPLKTEILIIFWLIFVTILTEHEHRQGYRHGRGHGQGMNTGQGLNMNIDTGHGQGHGNYDSRTLIIISTLHKNKPLR